MNPQNKSEIQSKIQKLNLIAHMYIRRHFNNEIEDQKILDLNYNDAIDGAIDTDRNQEEPA